MCVAQFGSVGTGCSASRDHLGPECLGLGRSKLSLSRVIITPPLSFSWLLRAFVKWFIAVLILSRALSRIYDFKELDTAMKTVRGSRGRDEGLFVVLNALLRYFKSSSPPFSSLSPLFDCRCFEARDEVVSDRILHHFCQSGVKSVVRGPTQRVRETYAQNRERE